MMALFRFSTKLLVAALILLTTPFQVATVNANVVASTYFSEGWYELVRVVDGDTIRVIGLSRSIRLAGINAPETYEAFGARATDTLNWLLHQYPNSGWVYLVPAALSYDPGTDRYRADVWFYSEFWGGWVYTQGYQVAVGQARVDRGYYASDYFLDYLIGRERYAQQRGCGIWGGVYC